MQRDEFLNQPDVTAFIDWLVNELPKMKFNLQMPSSRFVPGGLNVEVRGIDDVLPHYAWQASWTNPADGKGIKSRDWGTTRQSLQQLRAAFCSALESGNENAVYKLCLAVLEWGGVRGAIPFLTSLRSQNALISYLQGMIPRLTLNGSQRLSELNAAAVPRFDAGLTKIHALLDDSGSPIYDSRVGAAIAMLYARYRANQTKSIPAKLRFPSGAARGEQIRNPGQLGYDNAPQFFTRGVLPHVWAQNQLMLGWILQAALQRTTWFANEGNLPARLHAFEASLFMLGYDLRCFGLERREQVEIQPAANLRNHTAEPELSNWVPTGHPFVKVITDFLGYRQRHAASTDKQAFAEWLVKKYPKDIKPSTAKTYLYPLKENEFDLCVFSDTELESFVKNGPQWLRDRSALLPFDLGNERENVCLVDAWLVGRCHELGAPSRARAIDILMQAKFAGTTDAARTLRYVGSAVGQHFGLLDKENRPTAFFHEFYGDALTDLDLRLTQSGQG